MSNIQNTSAATVLSSDHGRMRRAERLIDKRDLQAALKYGTREASYNQRGDCQWKYRFADIVYITDETGRREITSWAKPGAGLDVEKVKISEKMKLGHEQASKLIADNVCNWTSHTVIVVDQSGSMRKTDVEGGATRSDAVWLTIAMDFVAKQLDSGNSTATDVVSIISMRNEGKILVDKKPHDWILFNTVVDLLRTQEPYFQGNYLPALDRAENLLLSNTFGSCALTLFFLSDGRPSDTMPRGGGGHYQIIGERIDALSSRFGRRLSLMVVGFSQSEDFSVLKEMANRPKKFQSSGKFFAAKLNPKALGEAFSSIATSLTTTRSELTAIGGSHQRAVRDVRRKAIDTVGQSTMPDDNNWYTYEGNYSRYVYSHKKPKGFVQSPTLTASVRVRGVALARSFFGEGAERLVREFREIGPNGRFVGPKLVAKESRFQMDIENIDQRQILNFQKTFCDTQGRAQGLANVFNERLEKLPGYDPITTPKISFLDCSVYFVNDINLGTLGCLVEKQLDPLKYKKWNDNCGAVNGDRGVIEQSSPPNDMLDIIAEESDEEEDSEYESEEENDSEVIHPLDIPQAFSHFTYRYTKRKLLVCDLQGVLSETIPPLFELTDPVIHFLSRHGKKNTFGRTDRGRSGRNDFFRTHKCSPLCRMLMRRHVRRVGSEQRSSHFEGLEENVSNLHFN